MYLPIAGAAVKPGERIPGTSMKPHGSSWNLIINEPVEGSGLRPAKVLITRFLGGSRGNSFSAFLNR